MAQVRVRSMALLRFSTGLRRRRWVAKRKFDAVPEEWQRSTARRHSCRALWVGGWVASPPLAFPQIGGRDAGWLLAPKPTLAWHPIALPWLKRPATELSFDEQRVLWLS